MLYFYRKVPFDKGSKILGHSSSLNEENGTMYELVECSVDEDVEEEAKRLANLGLINSDGSIDFRYNGFPIPEFTASGGIFFDSIKVLGSDDDTVILDQEITSTSLSSLRVGQHVVCAKGSMLFQFPLVAGSIMRDRGRLSICSPINGITFAFNPKSQDMFLGIVS